MIALRQMESLSSAFSQFFQLLSPFALGTGRISYRARQLLGDGVFGRARPAHPRTSWCITSHPNRARSAAGYLLGARLVFAAGRKLGLYSFLYAVLPGMDQFRVPSRSLFLASLAASILAGFGALTARPLRPGKRAYRSSAQAGHSGLVVELVIGLGSIRGSLPVDSTSKAGSTRSGEAERSFDDSMIMHSRRKGLATNSMVDRRPLWTRSRGCPRRLARLRRWCTEVKPGRRRLGPHRRARAFPVRPTLLSLSPPDLPLGWRSRNGLSSLGPGDSGPVRVASVGTTYSDLVAAFMVSKRRTSMTDFKSRTQRTCMRDSIRSSTPGFVSRSAIGPMDEAVDSSTRPWPVRARPTGCRLRGVRSVSNRSPPLDGPWSRSRASALSRSARTARELSEGICGPSGVSPYGETP